MKIKLDPGAKVPTSAHLLDAGFDLYSREDKIIPAHGSAVFDIGVHIALDPLVAGILKSKSGLNVKHDLLNTGVIDPGYTGAIVVKLYNQGDCDYAVKAGDKISQILFVPVIKPELEVVEDLELTERGDNGFGSSGR